MGTGNGVIISVPLNHPVASSDSASDMTSPIREALTAEKKGDAERPAEVKLYGDGKERLTAESFIPYCSMSQAQLSFHGHRDAVKFFVSVPGHGGLALNPTTSASPVKSRPGSSAADSGSAAASASNVEASSSMLVMSGGEGYIDFRIGESPLNK